MNALIFYFRNNKITVEKRMKQFCDVCNTLILTQDEYDNLKVSGENQ